MPTTDWEAFREKLNKRAKYYKGTVVKWHGKPHRVHGRYWRVQGNEFLYDLREIAMPGGHYIAFHAKVPEAELLPWKY